MKIEDATEKYETWLADHFPIVQADLDLKHNYMAEDVFTFMRATYYRWAQIWDAKADFKELKEAPSVLSDGDLHIENFGTWRDFEARLVWGINDFDEAYPLAYTADLVRLVTSASLGLEDGYAVIPMETISSHVLAGYKSGLKQGGGEIVLAGERPWLQELVADSTKDPERFWEKLTDLPARADPVPPEARKAIDRMLPEPLVPYKVSDRVAGVGSLGRPRIVAVMKYKGANAAREAKALVNSAASLQWLEGKKKRPSIYYNKIVADSKRSRDPFLKEFDGWVVRRLSPDYVRFDLSSLESDKLVGQVLNAMGWEVANVHLGSLDSRDAIKDVLKDLKDRGKDWLPTAADLMLEFLQDDFSEWSNYWLKLQGL